jgi:FtsZ-binding cell division protein ZapB
MALAQIACGTPRRSGVRHCFRRCAWAAISSAIVVVPWAAFAADAIPADQRAAKANAADQPVAEQAAGVEKPPDPAPLGQGFLIRVTLPITDDVGTRVRRAVTQLLGDLKPGGQRPALIIELWPGKAEGGAGSDFYRAKPLADFLSSRDLAGKMKTVAYIPKTVKGHAVLVAMACEEIIMAPDAEIGDAGIDEQVLGPTVRQGYAEIAKARSTIPEAVALAMLDRNLTALRVMTEVGTEYKLPSELDELKKRIDKLVEENEDYETEIDNLTRTKNSLEQDLLAQSNAFQNRLREKDREVKKLKEDLANEQKRYQKSQENLASEKVQHKGCSL